MQNHVFLFFNLFFAIFNVQIKISLILKFPTIFPRRKHFSSVDIRAINEISIKMLNKVRLVKKKKKQQQSLKKMSYLTDYNNINRALKHQHEFSFCINVKNEKKYPSLFGVIMGIHVSN